MGRKAPEFEKRKNKPIRFRGADYINEPTEPSQFGVKLRKQTHYKGE